MNVHMYENRTQHNMAVLKSDGYQFLEPGEVVFSMRLCSKGRMEEPLQILTRLETFLTKSQ